MTPLPRALRTAATAALDWRTALLQVADAVEEQKEPTPDNGPEFSPMEEAIWGVIKNWDICRGDSAGYAGANGDDVRAIAKAVRQCFGPVPDYAAQIEWDEEEAAPK